MVTKGQYVTDTVIPYKTTSAPFYTNVILDKKVFFRISMVLFQKV